MEKQKQHSEWKISTNIVAGKEFYQVYRVIDVNEVDHSGNRETRGGFYERLRDAQKLARHLNTEEAVK